MNDLRLFCTECNEDLVIHADGTIACGCSTVWSEGESVPKTWTDNFGEQVDVTTLEGWAEFERLGQ